MRQAGCIWETALNFMMNALIEVINKLVELSIEFINIYRKKYERSNNYLTGFYILYIFSADCMQLCKQSKTLTM